jgi:hypothetical protein
MKPVHMSHVAYNPLNQPLVDAMGIVLAEGPQFPTLPSCHNIAYELAYLDPSSDGMEAYRASGTCTVVMGISSSTWPVLSLMSEYGHKSVGYPWEGMEGAMRRQWVHTVREFVKNSVEHFKY